MTTAIKIEFSTGEEPAEVDFSRVVTGFESTAQAGMVNLGTERGSDPLRPTRGTSLFAAATVGALIDRGERQHATALAAEQTRLFLRGERDQQGLSSNASERVRSVGLEVRSLDLKKIVFNASFVSVTDQVVGQPLNNSL